MCDIIYLWVPHLVMLIQYNVFNELYFTGLSSMQCFQETTCSLAVTTVQFCKQMVSVGEGGAGACYCKYWNITQVYCPILYFW